MTEAAAHPSPRDLPQCLAGLMEAMSRLSGEFGVVFKYDPVVGEHTGTFNAATNTVTIDPAAPLGDQFALVLELCQLLTIGPEAVRWGQRTPALRLVPTPSEIDIS